MADDNKLIIVDESTLKDKIYIIRGKQVMLDFDLAEIYGYSTRRFNEQVKNNKDKFIGFMFRLSDEELKSLARSQKSTARIWTVGNNRVIFSLLIN